MMITFSKEKGGRVSSFFFFIFILCFFIHGCNDTEKDAMNLYFQGRNVLDEVNNRKHIGNEVQKLKEVLLTFEKVAREYPATQVGMRLLNVSSDPYTISSIKGEIYKFEKIIANIQPLSQQNASGGQAELILSQPKIATEIKEPNASNPKQIIPNLLTSDASTTTSVSNSTFSVSADDFNKISKVLNEKGFQLPTIEDCLFNYVVMTDGIPFSSSAANGKRIFKKNSDKCKDFEFLTQQTTETRINNAIGSFSQDFAILPLDLNMDGYKEFLVETKKESKRSLTIPG